jgi:hypothetical protein
VGKTARRGGNAAGCGLLQCRWLNEEAGECDGGSTSLKKEKKWGGREKGRHGGSDAHFNGDWRRGAEEGGGGGPGWHHMARRWGRGMWGGGITGSGGNGPRLVGVGGVTCVHDAVGAGRRWLTGGLRLQRGAAQVERAGH